jgi:hypothetical protein
MRAGLVRTDGIEVGSRHAKKRPPRCGEEQPQHTTGNQITGIVGRQGLEDGVVFAVNRQQGCTVFPHRPHEYRAGHDQGLLVGQEDFLAGDSGRQGGRQARCANDGGHHRIDFGKLHHPYQRLGSMRDPGRTACSRQPHTEVGRQGWIAKNGMARLKLEALFEEAVRLAVCAKRDDTIALPVAAQDIKRTDPDRPRRSENRKLLHRRPGSHQSRVTNQTRATSGRVEVRLSIRSSIPP